MRLSLGFRFGPLRLSVPLASTRRRRPRQRYWVHPGCQIHHQREDTANRHAAQMRRGVQ